MKRMFSFIRKTLRNLFLLLFLILMPLLAIVSGTGFGILQGIWEQLPDIYLADLNPALTTSIMDRNGELIETMGVVESRYKLVRLSELPEYVKSAFVAIEDERFYQHIGLDFRRIFGAALIDLRKRRFAHGASTITQQLVRNVYLHPEKTITRKLREMILALRMEYKFTKDEILEMYLNTVFFGGSNYGIASASLDYFGKTAAELTLAEAALLSATLVAPNRFSPVRNFDLVKKRQLVVLRKMLELGFISQQEYDSACVQELRIGSVVNESEVAEVVRVPYFTKKVKTELIRLLGRKKVLEGGLRVTTTIDLQMQKFAEESFNGASLFRTHPLSLYPDLQGAMVVLKVGTGDVLAHVGGRDFQVSQYDRVTQSRRQLGSCFKPFVYAAAFEKGISPNQIINDAPVSYYIQNEQREWTPENYGGSYHGPSLLRTALEHSYNIVAIKLLEMTGIPYTIEVARKMGFYSPMRPNLTLALGSTDVYPIELASSMSCFVNEGIHTEPRFILHVDDSRGMRIYESEIFEHEAISSETAFMVFDMLKSVVKNGSGKAAQVDGLEVGGKTGTNQQYIDAWFAAVTPDLSVVTTFGYNERKSLGERVPGALIAAPVVGSFLNQVKKHQPHYTGRPEPQKPPGIVTRYICRSSGLLAGSRCPARTAENFRQGREPQAACPIHNLSSLLEPYFD
jgi:penicillin-binding protein 1A